MAPAAARLAAAVLLAAASVEATSFAVTDRWSYVSGTAVTLDGDLQPNVWHDATTGPVGNFKVKLTIETAAPFSSGQSFQPIKSTDFISVVGTTPLGAPVTTGYKIGTESYFNLGTGQRSRFEIVLTFDSKTTDVAGTTFQLTYNCALLKNGPSALADTAAGCTQQTPLFQTVKIGWVPS